MSNTKFLSKSLFMKGLQCHKYLYLQKYHPELLDEVTEGQEAVYQSGSDVGRLAQDLFPGGITVPYEGLSPAEQIDLTRREMEKGTKSIYEAALSHEGVFVKVDILHKGDKGWELYEVKSSTEEKPEHINDIAVQYHVLKGAGVNLSRASLVHINTEYVRNGDIEVEKLFVIKDLTDRVIEIQPEIAKKLSAMRAMLECPMPDIDIGPHCNEPYDCAFIGHCWSHIPEQSVFSLRDRGRPDAMELYRQGIIHIKDIPHDILGWRQKLQVNGLLYQKNHINQQAVEEFLNTLRYPLCFMDFETTYMVPIPLFDGTSPYQQVPFQYSMDIIDQPGDELQHYEFLSDGKDDPRPPFLQSLLSAIPENACILTWNNTFETTRLRELAEAYPSERNRIEALIDGIVDLMVPFRQKDIYHWQFNGSYSIKDVLPALVPELSYDNLDISDGAMASDAWVQMIQTTDPEEAEEIKKQLLAYCSLDTLAMVRILEKMREMVG